MPKFSVTRSLHIDASPDKVYRAISDFHTWPTWSPWLISEPTAKVDVKPDGQSYSWEGIRVGSGGMSIERENKNSSIDFDLQFLKPWKSQAKTGFTLKKNGTGTDVTWNMKSSLPFFMFFMKKMMVAMIGNDYARGLNLLKDFVEDGEVHSKLNFIGQQPYEGCSYVGIKRDVSISESGKFMESDFTKLIGMADQFDGAERERAVCIYHKWDFVKDKASYTVGLPVKSYPANLGVEYVTGSIPACNVYSLEHVGNYNHLGNAWNTMYSMMRGKEFKPNKKFHPFETYGNSPKSTKPEDLITTVNFVVK